MLVYAGVALSLLLVCQINAPSMLHRPASLPCQEQAGLAACVVMGPKKVRAEDTRNQGFTLVEMSIVLVIIGLVVGGLLVGQDLINAANARSQISQIDKYNAAVHAFQLKFNALPGDMNAATASAFGFQVSDVYSNYRGEFAGAADGNTLIEGYDSITHSCGWCIGNGEPVLFWDDLTYANGMNLNMVEGSFQPLNRAMFASIPTLNGVTITGTVVDAFFPVAKIGQNNHIYVHSFNNDNYFGLSQINLIQYNIATGASGISVVQAYNIDSKIDDGLPQTGNVLAEYAGSYYIHPTTWAAAGSGNGANPGTAAAASASTCYDNGNSAAKPMQYSISQNKGTGINCGLSFKFQ